MSAALKLHTEKNPILWKVIRNSGNNNFEELDYYPFGNVLDGRKGGNGYRYGFNGQENQNELYGNNNATTAEYWMYDSRLGRRWNVDPVTYPWQSSYAAFNNNPIYYSDPLGLEGGDDDECGADDQCGGGDEKTLSDYGNAEIGIASQVYGLLVRNNINLNDNKAVSDFVSSSKEIDELIKNKDQGFVDDIDGVLQKMRQNNAYLSWRTNEDGKKWSEVINEKYRTESIEGDGWVELAKYQENVKFAHFQIFLELSAWGLTGASLGMAFYNMTIPKLVRLNSSQYSTRENVFPVINNAAAKPKFTVPKGKWDFFFGRVVTGKKDNILRSAQNLKDLTTMGIKTESQLLKVFEEAFEEGIEVGRKTTQYGVSVSKTVNMGNGSITVRFFYKGGNMSATPTVSSILPKIFKE